MKLQKISKNRNEMIKVSQKRRKKFNKQAQNLEVKIYLNLEYLSTFKF